MVAILHMQLVEKKSWMASKLLCCKKGDCPLTCEATWLCMHRSVSRTDDCEVGRIGWGLLFSKCVFLRVSELIGQDIVCGLLHGFNGSIVWLFCIQWSGVWHESSCIPNMRKKVVQSLYKAWCIAGFFTGGLRYVPIALHETEITEMYHQYTEATSDFEVRQVFVHWLWSTHEAVTMWIVVFYLQW